MAQNFSSLVITFCMIFLYVNAAYAHVASASDVLANPLAAQPNFAETLKYNALREEEVLKSYLMEQFPTEYSLQDKDLSYLMGKVIIIIGGAGKIGSELARFLTNMQIQNKSHFFMRKLVIVDNNENSLYSIRRELQDLYGMNAENTQFSCVLSDIRDEKALSEIFAVHKPNVVFHYANYKSVVLGNSNPREFFNNNVLGTKKLFSVIGRSAEFVETVVFISSDKAQSPSIPYGRTKRIIEHLVKIFSRRFKNIRFSSMRYCNVLDAAGSFAIPAFRDQISSGKNVTIRQMANGEIPNRYFMPVSLAAKLAVKAGAEAKNNESFIFSLNKKLIRPIRIDELVKLIGRVYGVLDVETWFAKNVKMVPGVDGEKTEEELGVGEALVGTPLIRISNRVPISILENYHESLMYAKDLTNAAIDRYMADYLEKVEQNSK